MSVPEPIQPFAACTCDHPPDCRHGCHDHRCDPGEEVCSIEFRPDEGGFTSIGCAACTPGVGAPHLADCPTGLGMTNDASRPGDHSAIQL